MPIAVVVVSHNTREDALACIESIDDADEIVLVDAGSTDGTVQAVVERYPFVKTIAAPNLGFGKSCNLGAKGISADFIIFSNADVRFKEGAIRALEQFLSANNNIGLAGPKVLYPDGRLQSSVRLFPDFMTAIGHAAFSLVWPSNPFSKRYRMSDWDKTSERDVDWVSGCCMAVRRSAFVDVNGFDRAYFMFVEDVDLCWRLHKEGWRVVFTPTATVTHLVGSSVKGRKAAMVKEHARSLDYFVSNRYKYPFAGRVALRAGLLAWVLSVIAWSYITKRTHGSNG